MPTDPSATMLRYPVPGLRCGGCRAAITRAVAALPGVHGVEVDLGRRTVTVTGPDLDDARVRAAIAGAGYEVAS